MRRRVFQGSGSSAQPRRRWRTLAIGTLVAVFAWLLGFVVFANGLPQRVERPSLDTDAIVVLTGGRERVAVGLGLLDAGLAKALLISGVDPRVDLPTLLGDEPPPSLACCISLGHEAEDTRGNAQEAAAWMGERDFTSLRLVTAAYHMPRAMLEFRAAMPDVELVPNPVFPADVHARQWWLWPGSARLIAQEYCKYLLSAVRLAVGRVF